MAEAVKGGERGSFADIWPARSPYLNPRDFWLCNHLEQKLYHSDAYPHKPRPQLQDSITALFAELQASDVQKARMAFWEKATWAAERDGAFIADKVYKKPNAAR